MEVRASGKRLRVPPRKARLVAHEIKGKSAAMAAAELRYHPSKAAFLMRKVLMSAVANAVDTGRLDADSLMVSRIEVDEGLRYKRIKARAQGRANRILKRTCHITITLGEGEPFELRKSNAAPKPRPKFDTKKKGGKKKEEPAVEVAAIEAEPTASAEEKAEEVTEAAPEIESAAEELTDQPAEPGDEEGKQE